MSSNTFTVPEASKDNSAVSEMPHLDNPVYDDPARDDRLANLEIGQRMADDGITYSPEREDEIIGMMSEYMKRAGFKSKVIFYLLNYDEDYITDQLRYLPREKEISEEIKMELKDLRNLAGLSECGMAPMPASPPTPASMSVSAASGSELSGMLKDLMSLAGLQKVEPAHLGVAPAPMKLLPEPVKAVGPAASDGEVMRGIADKMNLDKDKPEEGLAGAAGGALAGGMAAGPLGAVAGGLLGSELEQEEKADEAWDNAPADPEPKEPFDAEEYANHENPPGAGKGRRTMQPNATVEEIAENLFAEYAKFISEDEEVEEAKDEEVEEEKSWFDMDSKERAAHVAAGKSKAHRSGGQPGHGAAPAKTGKGDIMRQAADTKAHTGKSEYKGKEDDV